MSTEVSCAWCGGALLSEECPFRMTHNTQQVDHLCSYHCELRHRAYMGQCECGWWHSNTRCPKCGFETKEHKYKEAE
jgi:hypothetical protein